MPAQERDFLVELEDARRVTSIEMQAIVNRLPSAELIPVADVALALNISKMSVYAMIQAGDLRAVNYRGARGNGLKASYRVVRVSVLEYIKNHLT